MQSGEADFDAKGLGDIKNFIAKDSGFVPFDIQIQEAIVKGSVGPIDFEEEMPFAFSRGRILFQTAYARAGIRNVRVETL